MTKRDVIIKALQGRSPPYVPWSFSFTQEARDKLVAHYGAGDLEDQLQNHIVTVADTYGFFTDIGRECVRDSFGVVWDRHIDKDIGNVRGQVLPEPTLRGFQFPDPRSPQFFADIHSSWHGTATVIACLTLVSRCMNALGHCAAWLI